MKSNILYIDDHTDNMALVKRIIRQDSYNLIEARNDLQWVSSKALLEKVNILIAKI